ncbi:hypothetical protein KFL_000290010 [Klebsormidium nitens]|uniref:Patatin n=1 Tax=Klebsormidium nitens TaxID=105231 RepID=A0A1Y1HNP0_KLENI|nr:hypothetical protein KFL_000290010 [Klebsormidium nitens]|eukprot:GAQ79352.1 hypothetical protein KFL_000290010 [Klebsormidium nitens]
MAGAGLITPPVWAAAPQALISRAGTSRGWHAEVPRFLCHLHPQNGLAVRPLPSKSLAEFQNPGRSFSPTQVSSHERSCRSFDIRSEVSGRSGNCAESCQRGGSLPGKRALPFAAPSPQSSRARSRLHALAGPLLDRLRGQKRHATEGDEDLQLRDLLEDLNQRIQDLNSQLRSSQREDGGGEDGGERVPLLKTVNVPAHLVLKKSESEAVAASEKKGQEAALEEEWTPSALTTMLVDYSMMVASIWAMNGTIKQALGQQVPAVAMSAVNSIGQPALDAVKSVAPPVVKYIGEPAMVAVRYAGIPQGIGRVSDFIRSTPDLRGRLGGNRNRRRLSGVAAASRLDRQGSQSVDDNQYDFTDIVSAANRQSLDCDDQGEGSAADASPSWWKGTLGSWEPLRWWGSSGEGKASEEEGAAAAQDPLIWPRLTAAREASTAQGSGETSIPEKLGEAGVIAAGEGILGAKVAGAQEQPSEAPGWDGGQKGEDPQQPLGFSFSAAGLLFPYHLGVCQKLMEAGLLTDKTPLAGSSAGAIVSAALGAGVSPVEALQMTKDLAKDCRKNGTAGRLGAVLRGILHEVLPENCHEMCNGRVRVAVTQLFRWPRGILVDEFYSKQDVIEALITSSFIPGYLAPAAANVFRDRYCIDGGMTLFMPPTAGEETIRVCAFPASAYGLQGVQISPDCNPDGRVSLRQLLSWALEPPSDGILDELYLQGHADAAVWVNSRTSANKEGADFQLAQV